MSYWLVLRMPVKLVWSLWNLSVHFLCLWKLKILAVQLAASTPLNPASLTRHRLLGPALRQLWTPTQEFSRCRHKLTRVKISG